MRTLNKAQFTADMMELARLLIPTIDDDCRAYPDSDDDDTAPSMLVTVGADSTGWGYQTGDNSFSGAAYSFATWACVAIYRDTKPAAFAAAVLRELDDAYADEGAAPIFSDNDKA